MTIPEQARPLQVEIAEQIARDASCAQGEFGQRVLSIIPYLTDVCDRASLVGVERAAPLLRVREEIAEINERIESWHNDERTLYPDCEVLEFCDLVERALSSTAGQEWRDISSAPKDGTKIILYHEKWETFPLASWEWGEGPDEDGTGGWCAWHVVDDRFPGAEDGIIYPSENYMPTHWLPAPPVAEPIVAEERTP